MLREAAGGPQEGADGEDDVRGGSAGEFRGAEREDKEQDGDCESRSENDQFAGEGIVQGDMQSSNKSSDGRRCASSSGARARRMGDERGIQGRERWPAAGI